MTNHGPLKQRATDLAYEHIRHDLMAGRWPTGTHLREAELSRELNMSRTPVREALRRLSAEALLVFEPHLGATVQGWSHHDVHEIFELRLHLESLAAALAARNATPAQIAELDGLAYAFEAAAKRRDAGLGALTEANDRFHRLIIQASGYRRLAQLTALLIEVPLQVRTFARYDESAMGRSIAHHFELVEAIRSRDETWARAVMQAHIQAGRQTMIAALGTQPAPSMYTMTGPDNRES